MAVEYQDYYKILGIDRNATDKEIKSAYRRLAKKWHPDLQPPEKKKEAEEQIKRINEAYEALSDPQKRAKYDQLGSGWQHGQEFHYEGQPGMGGFRYYRTSGDFDLSDFSEFFAQFFGGGDLGGDIFSGRSQRRRGAERGQDVESEIELTVEEAYRGTAKSLRLATEAACTACGGSGIDGRGFCPRCGGTGLTTRERTLEVRIPKGVRDGSRIRLKGQGHEGRGGAPSGDLYLKVRLRPHPLYRIKGSDVESDLTIRPEQAVLGDRVTVYTLDGPVTVTVPPGSRSGTLLRLKGKGFPAGKGERGHHYVRLAIDIPAQISAAERELYRKISQLSQRSGSSA